jgi:molybdenum cofactor cytidylyltransferase
MIAAIILAAGASRRMGCPKALLQIDGRTFVRRLVEVLQSAQLDTIVVVLGAHAQQVSDEIVGLNVLTVVNEEYEKGQLSSLLTGIDFVEPQCLDAVLVCPVDHPSVSREVVVSLVGAFKERSALIAVPTFKGRRGHPVLFSRTLFDELRGAPADVGARHVLRSHAADVVEVGVVDEGVLVNVDTWDDYRELQRRHRLL